MVKYVREKGEREKDLTNVGGKVDCVLQSGQGRRSMSGETLSGSCVKVEGQL